MITTKDPKVSVLIPAYNAEKFIQRTIMSVLTQTFNNLEIIVLDDGSDDGTQAMVRSMQAGDKRIMYRYQKNQGLSPTRNRLVEMSTGEYIAFLDHDDEWLPGKIEKQLKLFQKNNEIGLIFSDAFIKLNGNAAGRCFSERKPYKGDIFYPYLFSDNFAPLPTVLLPRNVLLAVMPFNPAYEVCEEFDLFLRVAYRYKFDYINEPLAVYHIHGENTVISKGQKLVEESFSILNYWCNKEPDIKTMHKKELRRRLSQLYCKKGIYHLSKSDFSEVNKDIVSSFRHKLFNRGAVKLSIKLLLNILQAGFKDNG